MEANMLAEANPRAVLKLVKEDKFQALLGDADDRLEASGVCFQGGFFYVIFDNLPHILKLSSELAANHPDNHWFRQPGEATGYEDITYHPRENRFYVLIEAQLFDATTYKARVEVFDEAFRFVESHWLDFIIEAANKGLEGLTYVQRGEKDYLLGLCEGNKCKGGLLGRKPGGGRIQIFQKDRDAWGHKGVIKLPKSVQFEDYASLNVAGNQIAVASQTNAAVWVGRFKDEGWELADDGIVYAFPKNENGKTIYCNIEGVSWVTPRQIVAVSDKTKTAEQPKKCQQKDQSIHLFDIPE
jgi:hypothetical protein